jgi:SAM-dependent methyltransferase
MSTVTVPDYQDRPLSAGYPGLEQLAVEYFRRQQSIQTTTIETVECIARLIDFSEGLRTIVVVGCGPKPHAVRDLLSAGYHAVGIEPVPGLLQAAREFLGSDQRALPGTSELLPIADGSQRVVLMESVLEHVDSPSASLREAYRVLAPGGVLYVATTNRLRFSLTGMNDEFRTRYFNWFPATLKEAYVFHHLHYNPTLANFSLRPAVHWWTYADLCRAGREAGFAQFYSRIDLMALPQPGLTRWLIRKTRRSPWLRALALIQFGSTVFMLKRGEGGGASCSTSAASPT